MKRLGIMALACILGAFSVWGMTATSSMLNNVSSSTIKSSNIQKNEDIELEKEGLNPKEEVPDDLFVDNSENDIFNQSEKENGEGDLTLPPVRTPDIFKEQFSYSSDNLTSQQKLQELCDHYKIKVSFPGEEYEDWYLQKVILPVCEKIFPYLEGETKYIDLTSSEWGVGWGTAATREGFHSLVPHEAMDSYSGKGTPQYQFAYGLLHEGAHNKDLAYEDTSDAVPRLSVYASGYAEKDHYEQFAEFYAKAILEPEETRILAQTYPEWNQSYKALDAWMDNRGLALPTENIFRNPNYSLMNPRINGRTYSPSDIKNLASNLNTF